MSESTGGIAAGNAEVRSTSRKFKKLIQQSGGIQSQELYLRKTTQMILLLISYEQIPQSCLCGLFWLFSLLAEEVV